MSKSRTYCRRELVGYHDASEAELRTAIDDLANRVKPGRCPSCAARLHDCERDDCTCPVLRCEDARAG